MNNNVISREEQIKQLKQYQVNELNKLQKQIVQIDNEMNQLSMNIFEQTNLVSALRGIVSMRSKNNINNNGNRIKNKNRLWLNRNGQVFSTTNNCTNSKRNYDLNINGVIYTSFQKRFEAPRQSLTAHATKATIIYNGNIRDQFHTGEYIWLLYWLDRNDGEWRQFVKPPRYKNSNSNRIGLFATRSPNRPSPLGLSLCKIINITNGNNKMIVNGVDILDETPLIKIWKYNSKLHSFLNIHSGWLDDHNLIQPLYYDSNDESDSDNDKDDVKVIIEDIAAEKLNFIEKRSIINIKQMIYINLIRKMKNDLKNNNSIGIVENSFPVGAFRILYNFDFINKNVIILDIISGMRKQVCEEEVDSDPEAALHLSFQKQYSESQNIKD